MIDLLGSLLVGRLCFFFGSSDFIYGSSDFSTFSSADCDEFFLVSELLEEIDSELEFTDPMSTIAFMCANSASL